MSLKEENLERIECLLAQSMRGIHGLFEHQRIAQILRTPMDESQFFTFDNMDRIQDLFLKLIEAKDHWDKIRYLDSLDPEAYELIVRAYFHILDNTLLATSETKH